MPSRPPWLLRRTSRLARWQRRTAVGQCPCGHQRNARGHDLVVCNDLRIGATSATLAVMDDSSLPRTDARVRNGCRTCGMESGLGSAVLRSIDPVRTICPRWTPSTVQGGVRRRVSDDRAAPSLLQVLGHAVASSLVAANTSMLHLCPLDTSSTADHHRRLTATASAVASRHLATAASPHPPPLPTKLDVETLPLLTRHRGLQAMPCCRG